MELETWRRHRSRVPSGHRRLHGRPHPRRRGDRVRIDAAVDAVDREVRLELLADTGVGPGGWAVRRAAVHLGHAVLIDSRARDFYSHRARDRGVHLRTLSQLAEAAAG